MSRIVSTLCLCIGLAACAPSPRRSSPGSLLPADFQRGVNYAHIHRRGHGYGSASSEAELAYLKQIGVNWIAITPFGYQDGAAADQIVGFEGHEGASEFFARHDPSMTDQDLANQVATAHALGIRVTLKPLLWSRDFWDGREWHGSIRQATAEEHARWWSCYRAFALYYARLAERAQCDQYCIGTELVQMTTAHPDEWRALITQLRKEYRGPLTYAAHWEHELDEIPFWDMLDFIGVSAYYPLAAPEHASVDQLVAAWKPHRKRLQTVADRFHRPVLFLEVGYRAVSGCHLTPWTYTGGQPDPQAQARAYEALFRAFASSGWWKGTYFWKTFTDPEFADARGDGKDFSFRGLPAEQVVGAWYGGQAERR